MIQGHMRKRLAIIFKARMLAAAIAIQAATRRRAVRASLAKKADELGHLGRQWKRVGELPPPGAKKLFDAELEKAIATQFAAGPKPASKKAEVNIELPDDVFGSLLNRLGKKAADAAMQTQAGATGGKVVFGAGVQLNHTIKVGRFYYVPVDPNAPPPPTPPAPPRTPPEMSEPGPLDRIKSPVYVKSLEGDTHEFEVSMDETVAELKAQISSRVGTPQESYRVKYNDRPLDEEGRPLSEYDVWKMSYLVCSPTMSECCWSLPTTPGLPYKFVRPKLDAEGPRVLNDIKPVMRKERRQGAWSSIGASWESDQAARAVLMRLGRENEDLVCWPEATPAYAPDLRSLSSSTSASLLHRAPSPDAQMSMRSLHSPSKHRNRNAALPKLTPRNSEAFVQQLGAAKRLGFSMRNSVSLPVLLPARPESVSAIVSSPRHGSPKGSPTRSPGVRSPQVARSSPGARTMPNAPVRSFGITRAMTNSPPLGTTFSAPVAVRFAAQEELMRTPDRATSQRFSIAVL